MRYYFSLIFAALVLVSISSCTSKQEQPKEEQGYVDERVEDHMQRTNTDTLAVLYLVKKYLNFLKENQVDSAMAMLYVPDTEELVPISDEKKAELESQLQIFPVLDYEITSMNMFSEDNTEVHYSIKYMEKEDENDPLPNTIQCVINPRRYGYYWYLTIKDVTR